ncbi:hypothetical protein DF268_12020 [Streptomyces sp. V2]|uniref:YrhB domain-containing protein n=1 Tax=Streptomyces sp. V2 TaxID=1424099 RepID=UPI000D66A7F9|nr:YrhB domain-containing protein [Streptomyces sp. V2]PWG13386.1 hypothetical protein DF268_12020 [Streptomyces sp. V2]
MIGRETARRLVQEELDRGTPRAVVVDVREHELVWIVSWQSEQYVRTREPEFALAGNGPYLVDRVDGGLHVIGVLSALGGEWEDDYRARIRGLPVRTALDELHDALRESAAIHGHTRTARNLRRKLPTLSPAEALAYVSGLADGDVPPRLLAVATAELVPPLDPVLAVGTVRT